MSGFLPRVPHESNTRTPGEQGWPSWLKTILAAGVVVFALNQAGISPLEPLQDIGILDRCIENAFGVEYCGEEAVSYCRMLEPFSPSATGRESAELCREVYESEGVNR